MNLDHLSIENIAPICTQSPSGVLLFMRWDFATSVRRTWEKKRGTVALNAIMTFAKDAYDSYLS